MSASVKLRPTDLQAPLSPHALVTLSPYVGTDLAPVPHSSAFGVVSRLVRLNTLVPADLAPLLGTHILRSQDLSSLMTFSDARQLKLAEALHLPEIPPSWNLSIWFPFAAPSKLMADLWAFRFCPECLRSGYHTHLHQMPWFGLCPWHVKRLQHHCDQCGAIPSMTADWAAGQNFICACGHALLETRAAVERAAGPPSGAQAFLDRYLAWAAKERSTSALVPPPMLGDPMSALANLVQLPYPWGDFGASPKAMHTRTWSVIGRPATDGTLQTLRELETLRRERPVFVKLSAAHARACGRVAADIALKLPAKTLADDEMTLFLAGAGISTPASFPDAKRPFPSKMSNMTPWRNSAVECLNLTCLHPAAYLPVVHLVDSAMSDRSLADFHSQCTSEELEVLVRACGQILARGYAEGLRSLLAPYVPKLMRMGRNAPHLTQPWLIVRRREGRLDRIKAVWEPLRTAIHEAKQTQTADINRLQKRNASGGRKPRPHR